MFEFIKKLFRTNTDDSEQKPQKTLKDLEFFDDIWVEEDGVVYSGWIYEISRRCITVVYDKSLRDYRFQIPRPLTLTKIEQDNKILYCNKPC